MLILTTTPITLTPIALTDINAGSGRSLTLTRRSNYTGWEAASQLYERYDFRDARELVFTIRQVMEHSLSGEDAKRALYDPLDLDRVTRLIQVLEMYGAWENGDYREAKRIWHPFASTLPPDIVPDAILAFGGLLA